MVLRFRQRLLELAEETLRRDMGDLLAGCLPHGPVGGDDHDPLALAVLCGQAFEHIVRVSRVADLERAVSLLRPLPVENNDAARTLKRDEARETVDERASVTKRPRVQDVRPVEEVEHRLRMPG